MSRSYWHTPICGVTGRPSCKAWRSQENRRYRAYAKNLIRHGRYDDIQNYKGRFGNEWDSPRDGKVWNGEYRTYECGEYIWYFGEGLLVSRCERGFHWYCKKGYKELMRK